MSRQQDSRLRAGPLDGSIRRPIRTECFAPLAFGPNTRLTRPRDQ